MIPGPIILDLDSTSVSDEEQRLLQNPYVGGVILFSRNIVDYQQLLQLVKSIREAREDLVVCVDQEGGRVQRCKDGFTRLPAMQMFGRLYQDDPVDALARAKDCGWLLAAEVLAVGIDFSFTPVLDVDEEFCSVIGDRAFSADPDEVFLLSQAFIEGAHEAGMKVTGKHFPGHGSVRGDSHLELPIDDRSFAEIESHDLKPFAKLISSATGNLLDAVMPAHILFPAVDSELPVGFSSCWLKDILREQMHYDGVIFSDDLTMEGAAKYGSFTERTRLALDAGCDVILVCNNRQGALEVLNYLAAEFPLPCESPLTKMRAVEMFSKEKLERNTRWQDTRQWLAEVN
jgi:beta-N-acetylhexosaminidase